MAEEQPDDIELNDTYQAAIQKGKELYRRLTNFGIRQPPTDLIHELYRVQKGALRQPAEFIAKIVDWRIFAKDVGFVEVYPAKKKEKEAIYTHHVDSEAGLLVVHEVIKALDTNAADKKLRPSEVGWQSFLSEAMTHGNSSMGLRAVVLSHIVNSNTRDVVYEASRMSSSTATGPNGQIEFTMPDSGFFAIIGSVLGSSVINLLLDHKAETGYRLVERVVILGREDLIKGQEWGKARTVLILLSLPRQRDRARSEPAPAILRQRPRRQSLRPIIEDPAE